MILPGQTIGILGGGQLGRMLALSARAMGYRVHVFERQPDSPAGQVADVQVTAAYDDTAAAERFARGVDVVTFEFENLPPATLAAIGQICPVHPSPRVLEITRNRQREKEFLRTHGFPVAPYRVVHDADELTRAAGELGLPAILKTAEFGYDGRGQSRVETQDQLPGAWAALDAPAGVLEGLVRFDREISVVAARTGGGVIRCYPPVENVHSRHILDLTLAPAALMPAVAQRATALATAVVETLAVVGVLTVELFVIGDELVVNELAPRPHNSGHYSIDACVTSQFEQQLRAVCGLLLGDVTQPRPAAMANLLGDLWHRPDRPGEVVQPSFAAALAVPGVKLHLYAKREPKPARKMGHLTATAQTLEIARERVITARDALLGEPSPHPNAR